MGLRASAQRNAVMVFIEGRQTSCPSRSVNQPNRRPKKSRFPIPHAGATTRPPFFSRPSPMADLKFSCPECLQHILVDDGAAGVAIDCPTCRSALVIPSKAGEPVKVTARRRLVALAGTADSAYGELERMKKDFAAAS